MTTICGFRPDTNYFCGTIHIRNMIYIAAVLMAFTQLYMTIWYLTYHVWWYFFGIGGIIAANVCLALAIKTRKPALLIFVLFYQAFFTLWYLVVTIDLIVIVCHPGKNTHIFEFSLKHREGKEVVRHVRSIAIIYTFVYLAFTAINVFCLIVLWYYYKYLTDTSPLARQTPNTAYTRTNPTPRRPPSPPPAAPYYPNSGLSSPTTITPAASPGGALKPPGSTSAPIFSTNSSNNLEGQTQGFGDYSSQVLEAYKSSPAPQRISPVVLDLPSSTITPNWNAPPVHVPDYTAQYNPYQQQTQFSPQPENFNNPPPLPPRPNIGSQYDTTPEGYY